MGVALIIVQNRRWHCRCLKHVWKRYSIMHLKTLQIFLSTLHLTQDDATGINGVPYAKKLQRYFQRHVLTVMSALHGLLPDECDCNTSTGRGYYLVSGLDLSELHLQNTRPHMPLGRSLPLIESPPDRSFSLFRCFCKPWIPLQQRREKRQRHTASLWLKTLLLKT